MTSPTSPLLLPTEHDTIALAERLAPYLRPGMLLVLSGALGAGKTFFTRALCHALGLPPDEPVTSPTFTLVHEHPTQPPIAHADLYRLETEREVRDLGLDERRWDDWLLVVEWGEPHIEALGGDALVLSFSLDPRSASLKATGPQSERVLEAVRNVIEG